MRWTRCWDSWRLIHKALKGRHSNGGTGLVRAVNEAAFSTSLCLCCLSLYSSAPAWILCSAALAPAPTNIQCALSVNSTQARFACGAATKRPRVRLPSRVCLCVCTLVCMCVCVGVVCKQHPGPFCVWCCNEASAHEASISCVSMCVCM
jgi:hypothetical protein